MKKNGEKIQAPGASKKVVLPPEKYFMACCMVWTDVYGEVVKPPPGEKIADPRIFKDPVEKRHLKLILKELRERAQEKNIVWDEPTATARFKAFIERAAQDEWVSSNFLLRIINNCKTKIFNNQINPKINGRTGKYGSGKGQSSRNNDYRPVDDQSGIEGIIGDTGANPEGNFGKL